MSQSKLSKIVVRPRPGTEGKIMTGATTQVFLDDKLLAGCYFMKFEVHARKIAKVTLEMYATVEIDGTFKLEESKKESNLVVKGKAVGVNVLSSYSPKFIAEKKDKA